MEWGEAPGSQVVGERHRNRNGEMQSEPQRGGGQSPRKALLAEQSRSNGLEDSRWRHACLPSPEGASVGDVERARNEACGKYITPCLGVDGRLAVCLVRHSCC